MASRSRYTYTPTYSRQPAKPRTQPAPRRTPARPSPARPSAARPPVARKPAPMSAPRPARRKSGAPPKAAGDTIVLLLLFLVVPLGGLFALFFQPMRWVFCLILLLALLSMLSLRCFLPRSRAFLSGTLSVMMLISLVTAIPRTPKQDAFPQFGAASANDQNVYAQYSTTNPPSLVGLTNPSTLPESQEASAPPEESAPVNETRVKTAAEEVLENYLNLWQMVNWNDMVQYTTPEWRESIQSPVQQLFYNHMTKKLLSWTITPPVIADNDTAAIIEVVATIELKGAPVKTQYSALLQKVDGHWFVDPASMASGMTVQEATPIPDQSAAPTSTPTPTTNPSMKLYYNKAGGGSMYHTKANCESINEKYWKNMVNFKYSQLGEKAYSKLEPCSSCNAPARP